VKLCMISTSNMHLWTYLSKVLTYLYNQDIFQISKLLSFVARIQLLGLLS